MSPQARRTKSFRQDAAVALGMVFFYASAIIPFSAIGVGRYPREWIGAYLLGWAVLMAYLWRHLLSEWRTYKEDKLVPLTWRQRRARTIVIIVWGALWVPYTMICICLWVAGELGPGDDSQYSRGPFWDWEKDIGVERTKTHLGPFWDWEHDGTGS